MVLPRPSREPLVLSLHSMTRRKQAVQRWCCPGLRNFASRGGRSRCPEDPETSRCPVTFATLDACTLWYQAEMSGYQRKCLPSFCSSFCRWPVASTFSKPFYTWVLVTSALLLVTRALQEAKSNKGIATSYKVVYV